MAQVASALRLQAAVAALRGSARRSNPGSDRDDEEVDWEAKWEDFIDSYRGHLIETDDLRVNLLDELVERPEYREALLPPKGYLYAWRLLHNVPEDDLRKLLGRDPPETYVLREARYTPTYSQVAASWTLDPSIFTEGRMPFLDVEQDVPRVGTYVVLIRAPLAQEGQRFWLNPDLLYRLADSPNLAGEREVVSTDAVEGCAIAWEEGHALEDFDPDESDEDDDYNERMLIPEIADRLLTLIESD